MASFNRKFSAQSLANSTAVASTGVPVIGVTDVTVYAKVDNHALTLQPQISPISLNDTTPPADADYFNLGSALALSANGATAWQVRVDGAASFRINVANASGGTAVFDLWIRPSVKKT